MSIAVATVPGSGELIEPTVSDTNDYGASP
jgi:hypothetical protein